ncbi:MAG TPA: S8/S53 family peptidase [Trebonia sp.]|nr:S8/S53 family peptidase [Trebonia sp.]
MTAADPGRPAGAPENLAQIQEVQAAYILANVPDAALYPLPEADGQQAGDFIYRRGHLVARHEDADRVVAALTGSDGLEVAAVSQLAAGVTHIRLAPHPSGDPAAEHEALFTALEAVHDRLGPGLAAPDHLVSITPVTNCPATEPDYVPGSAALWPPVSVSDCCTGERVRVAVVDTGLIPDAAARHSWLHGVTGDNDPEVAEGAFIDRYGGHGTFIASIIRAMAPQAQVTVHRQFEKAGAVYETDLVRELDSVLAGEPDVISLSAGTHTWRQHGLLSFQAFVNGPLRERGDKTVLVAAAGNDGQDWGFAPADLPGVISVGALNSDWDGRAWFSDYGDWVSVFAPGQDLVQAFARGEYIYHERSAPETANFEGMARWSGTSFSTPVVAGLIAARMSGAGETARAAAEALLATARQQLMPGVGPVLLPGQGCPHAPRS